MKLLMTAALALAMACSALAAGFSGTVKQTMNSGGYTYALLSTSTGEVWVAGPEGKVAVGQKLSTGDGMVMRGFNSKTLNRTFKEIWFVNSLGAEVSAKTAAPAMGHGKAADPHAGMPIAGKSATSSVAKPKAGSIKKAGYTVAELYFQPKLLTGKMVEVRGVVTKYNEGIMGSNWIHLSDGSGVAGKDDLVLTTSQKCKVGDRILARGKLAVDRDLGSGYFFPVLVESATVKVEVAGK